MKLYITGGGTGGHVTPGLAVAKCVRAHEPDSEIRFAGTQTGIESRLVPREGYPLDTIEVMGLSRALNPTGLAHNVKALGLAATSVGKAKKLLQKARPDCVLGCGGYASFPIVKAAQKMGIPTVLLEVNALPGKTTKTLAKKADRVLVCFECAKELLGGGENIFVTGSPVRREILLADRASAREKLGLTKDDRLVVSFWGSMGALYMNRHMAGMLTLEKEQKTAFHHIHASGTAAYEWMRQTVGADTDSVQLTEYIFDMADKLSAADLVLCRAGAATIGELTALGRPSIMVPSPFVAENHQEKNARALEAKGACEVLLESECTSERLLAATQSLLADAEKLSRMRSAAAKLGVCDADEQIYRQLRAAIEHKG